VRHRALEQSLLQYNAMQLGVFELLAARRAEVEAARGYIDALRDYWIARATLARVLAGRALDGGTTAGAPATMGGPMNPMTARDEPAGTP
jgi:cobalt-zinc-cadmium efflux system outer membrane protein